MTPFFFDLIKEGLRAVPYNYSGWSGFEHGTGLKEGAAYATEVIHEGSDLAG
jgi:hypothetical protein